MLIAGVDEAGRGPLAGPVVAAACILPQKYPKKHLKDSKLLTPKKRQELFLSLTQSKNVVWAIGQASVIEIDTINIHHATLLAMRRAIEALSQKPDKVLIDGLFVPEGLEMEAEAIVDGDATHFLISAASILAKVFRDRLMVEAHKLHPEYEFDKHKGYGTKKHLDVLKRLGPTPFHRKSFGPVRDMF